MATEIVETSLANAESVVHSFFDQTEFPVNALSEKCT
jgi:hypothetical protein